MGWQMSPKMGPGQMRDLLFRSAHTKETGEKIINPKKFISLFRKTKVSPRGK
jgi:hypothetical protein